MREPAFNTIALMLTVYVAALVWSIQHVSDRYSPKLLAIFFRRIALWPFLALVIMLAIAGILLFPHTLISLLTFWGLQLQAGDTLSFVLLVAAIILVLLSVYRMVSSLSKGTPIISWLRKRKDQIAFLEEILPNVIQRNDVRLAHESLVVALRGQPETRQAMIVWLEEHRVLLSTPWLARELLDVLLSEPFDAEVTDLLCLPLAEALDKEEFTQARFILNTLCETLRKTQPWTETHMNLLIHIGFTLWKIGEYGADLPRTVRIPEQLTDLQWSFFVRERQIWNHVLRLKNSNAVYYFIYAHITLLRETVVTKDLFEALLSHVYDILRDGYREQVLTSQTLQELVNELGHLRHELSDAENEDIQREIDTYMLASLAILVELGEKEETLRHTAGNGYMRRRITKRKWTGTYRFRNEPNYCSWLSPESYTAARRALGLPGLSRKQVNELIDQRSFDIQVELPVSDETSHLLLESSPEAPNSIQGPSL
jgi:hypothetical protein